MAVNNNSFTFNANTLVLCGNPATTSGGITINNGSMISFANNTQTFTVNGPVTGEGAGITLLQDGNGGTYLNFNSTANTFNGPIRFNFGNVGSVSVNSLADAASLGSGDISFLSGTQTFNYGGSSGSPSAPLTLNNRRFEMGNPTAATINNNSSQAFTINTDLLSTGTGTKTLTLGGTGAGLSTFAGKITNGTITTLNITKAGSGTWVLSGNNTYNGTTTVSAGTLSTNAAGALGASSVTVSAGTLQIDAANAMADTAALRLPSATTKNITMNANDTVGALFLAGVQMPNEIYTSSGLASGWMNGSGAPDRRLGRNAAPVLGSRRRHARRGFHGGRRDRHVECDEHELEPGLRRCQPSRRPGRPAGRPPSPPAPTPREPTPSP